MLDWYFSLLPRNKDGKSELDFDTDQYDILVTDFGTDEKETGGVSSELPETEYSLRVSKSGFSSTVRGKMSCNMKILQNRISLYKDDNLLTLYSDSFSLSALKQCS